MSDLRRIVAPARLIAALTMLSRVLGLVREMVYAYFFGTGQTLSALRVAWQIPNLFRRLFGEGALSAAFIPTLTDCLHHEGREAARRMAGAVLALLAVGLAGLVLVAEASLLVARAWWPSLTLNLTGILLPYMPLICLTALVGAMLQVFRRFAAPAAAPILLNVLIVAAAGVAGGWLGLRGAALMYVICAVVLAGGVAQLALVGMALRRTGFRPVVRLLTHHPQVRAVAAAMAPMVLGMSAVQINTLADSVVALFCVPDGRGPAVLGYAQVLYQLPLGVLGVALATAIFPLLSSRAAEGNLEGLTSVYTQGLRLSLFVGVPATIGLCLIAEPVLEAFFQRGDFRAADAARAAPALVFYAVAVWVYFLQQILVRTFYALKEHRFPARVAGYMVAVNLLLNLVLVRYLAEAGVALATAVCATLQVLWLARRLRARLPLDGFWGLPAGCERIALAGLLLAGAVHLPSWLAGPAKWGALPAGVRVAVCVFSGALTYALAAWVLKLGELREWLRFKRAA